MPFSYRRLFFGGTTFCCCLPVRFGVIVMSSLGCLVSGVMMILLWFEISTTLYMTTQERVAFVLAALTETVLFSASILGLVGAIVRKQLFTQIYTYILYFDFVINLVVAAYLTYEVNRASTNAETVACQEAIKDPQAQSQCTGLLTFAKSVYFVIAAIVLLVEMYGTIIAARYLNQLQREKGAARASRLDTERAFQLKPRNQHHYSRLPDPTSQSMLPPLDPSYLGPSGVEFNPYDETATAFPPRSSRVVFEDIVDGPPPPIEVGYGGGSWTHGGIADEEKERLKRREKLEAEGMSSQSVSNNEESGLSTHLV
ncbi:hypothetical protein BDZ97DRAFT_1990447 [Flammula alnicola]|nr:hypothetical protein BDZ97DRAFT_1990447 [Flammula alnicola]